MNAVNTLLMGITAALFAALSLRLSRRLTQVERENQVLWDQANRYEAYITQRASEDEERQRAAVRN